MCNEECVIMNYAFLIKNAGLRVLTEIRRRCLLC